MRRLGVSLLLAAAALSMIGPVSGQERTYTLDELAARCEAADPQIADPCLFILYTILAPEAGRTPPDLSGSSSGSDAQVTMSGERDQQTRPFELSGGDYIVTWTVSDTGSTSVGCYHGSSLEATDGSLLLEGRVTASPEGGETLTGETYVYALDPGRYYFDVISGCGWTLSIEPL